MKRVDKYALYERSVQSPEVDAGWALTIYRDLHGTYPTKLREDFCGTFKLSCAWVQRNRKNVAYAIDLDPEPLAYGRKRHFRRLKPAQKKRLNILRGDALKARTPKVDIVVVGNFSFNILKQRSRLLKYFRSACKGMRKNGVMILEMAGGPGMIKPMRERRTIKEKGIRPFTYIWHQRKFDPITRFAKYSIHFKFKDGTEARDAFEYDWRLWTIPEIRDVLIDAGFEETYVYWETTHKGEGTGEFARAEEGDNAYSWIAYVVGVAGKAAKG
jgi:SAM-dependent methyltransferase